MQTIGRLVGIVPTYNEGPLAASAIRSILPYVDNVVVFEGPVGDAPDEGHATILDEFAKQSRVMIRYGTWRTEADKRNEMVAFTRRLPTPTWGVYIDADEVFIGAEYIRDYIWAATVNVPDNEQPVALPVLITEIDGSVGRIHRIIRMDMLERHVLSMSQLQFFNQSVVAVFPVIPVWRPGEPVTATEADGYRGPPLPGTPFLHHRTYYRPRKRGEYRLHAEEVSDFNAELQRLGIRPEVPGMVPIHQYPGFIVAHEQEAPVDPYSPLPDDPFGLIGGGKQ